jgi:hypothetical protein
VHAARRLKDLDSLFVIYCALTLHAFGRLAAAAAAAAAAADDARHLFRVLSKVRCKDVECEGACSEKLTTEFHKRESFRCLLKVNRKSLESC